MRATTLGGMLVLCLLLAGCGGKKVYDREEWKKTFLGKSLTEVRATLGAPDEIENGLWIYRKRTRDRATGKVDNHGWLYPRNDRVEDVGWQP